MNTWNVSKALDSYRSLLSILQNMTEDEVLRALEIESKSQRRTVIIDKLIQKACELRKRAYQTQLKEQYHGKSKKRNLNPS